MHSPRSPGLSVLVVCTGNAARSVMVGAMLEELWDDPARHLVVATAGTHVVEGQPLGARTRRAMATVPGLAGVSLTRHRSRQVTGDDVEGADLVVGMEADHVRWLRRVHPQSASKSATLLRLVERLEPGPAPLWARVENLDLAGADLEEDDDVDDPAGSDDETYADCAQLLWNLTVDLAARL